MVKLGLVSTVVMLVWMGFFMMSSLPLLILKHDTPMDSGFIRGLFNIYYVALVCTAAVGAACYLLAGRLGMALALGAMLLAGFTGRRWFLARMDAVRAVMTPEDAAAIGRFRRLHMGGMLLNVAMLACVCVGMTRVVLY